MDLLVWINDPNIKIPEPILSNKREGNPEWFPKHKYDLKKNFSERILKCLPFSLLSMVLQKISEPLCFIISSTAHSENTNKL
jgi:hypothetical protein